MAAIKVYSTEYCPWCHKLKDYLKDKKIAFDAIDIGKDEKARNELFKKSGQLAVPQTEINGKIIVGFDRAAIDAEVAKMKK
ncbi:glutathione S-transferase N-terminal domain-containing protein [Candidatus Woesearchaeota archaeon]|nr:glutathione S-transferase N-terminal domain-containing protein [Candidatus Woesearchaeota archaeon]